MLFLNLYAGVAGEGVHQSVEQAAGEGVSVDLEAIQVPVGVRRDVSGAREVLLRRRPCHR